MEKRGNVEVVVVAEGPNRLVDVVDAGVEKLNIFPEFVVVFDVVLVGKSEEPPRR